MTSTKHPLHVLQFSFSRRITPQLLVLLVAATSWHLTTSRSWAETWSDNTGNFKIEAQFVAIQGDKVVLKKANGSTIQVPLARLNKASQDLAKRLAASPPATAEQAPDVYLRELFAANEAGDYQKVWNALPTNYQQDIHDLVHSFAANMDGSMWNQAADVLKKAVRVLKEKRQFILGHPQLALAGEALAKNLTPITEVLDATINSELTDLQKLKAFDVVKFAAADGKIIAEKMKAASEAVKELQKLAPPGAGAGGPGAGPNPFSDLADMKASDIKITVVKREGDSAVLKFDLKNKPGKEEEWVKVDGKWLPKKMVDEWQSQIAKGKQWTSTDMKKSLDGARIQMSFFITPINQTLDQLLAAQTQEQFNQVIENVQQQFGGGAADGPEPPGK